MRNCDSAESLTSQSRASAHLIPCSPFVLVDCIIYRREYTTSTRTH